VSIRHQDSTLGSVQTGDGHPLPVISRPEGAGWAEDATADNAIATATRAAVVDQRHYITGASGSFSAAAAGRLLEILEGANVIWSGYVHDQRDISFSVPIRGAAGGAVSARLAASGSIGVIGAVALTGFTAP
jgi:hypothetical protein